MENASKALIIAGAILLAIVIISLGLIVVNNTRDTVDSANISDQEIQAFNNKFTAYQGTKVSATRVKTLIQTVIASNQANPEKKVKVNDAETATDLAALPVDSSKNYNVTISYGTNGLVNAITYAVATN